MVVAHFLKWIETARVAERAAAASALARAYINAELAFEDRCAAEAALTLLLDDPSWKVRLALAEALSLSHAAPPQVISALAADQPEVAAMVLARSPLLSDGDLIDRAAAGDGTTQRLIAMRANVSMALAAAIAEIGEPEACLELLANGSADIAALSFARMAERHGHLPEVREAMLADERLPASCRHTLLFMVGSALSLSPLVVALMGETRAQRITREACVKASVSLVEGTAPDEYGALVEHLRQRGELTPGFILRVVTHGKIDFFGAVLVALTGQSAGRVSALLSNGRDGALAALFRAACLPAAMDDVLRVALKMWRDVANGRRVAGVQEVSWLMLKAIGAAPGQAGPCEAHRELAGLLRSIHLDELRANARGHALAIAAA